MNIDAYLGRIGYEGPCRATFDALRAIAHAHATTIPFENLSVLASGAPNLEIGAVEDKLVRRNRGGYCYEQNHLLLAALRAIGFDVTPLSARVRYRLPRETDSPRSHMVLCVMSEGRRWLADAGFGRLSLTAPVDIDARATQRTPHEDVRVEPLGDAMLLSYFIEGEWHDGYAFDFVRQLPVDYAQQNWYTATRPGGLFSSNLVVAMPAPGGRYTLFNRTLTWRPLGGSEERKAVGTIDELRDALAAIFGLRPDDAELERAWEVGGRGQDANAMFV